MKLWTAFALIAAGCGQKTEAGTPARKPAAALEKPAPAPEARTGDVILDEYLRVARALAGDSTAGIDDAARRLETEARARASGDEVVAIARAASALRGKGLADARQAFTALSQAVIRYRGRSPRLREKTVLVHCPMARASWLQGIEGDRQPVLRRRDARLRHRD
jgi:hypothetical protein